MSIIWAFSLNWHAFLPIFIGEQSFLYIWPWILCWDAETFENNWGGEKHSSTMCVCVSVDIFTQQLSVPDGEVASVPIWGHLTTHLHSCSSPIFHSIFALDKGGASADTKYNSTFRLGSSSWIGHFSAGQPGNKVYKIILKICILTSNLIDFFNHCNALYCSSILWEEKHNLLVISHAICNDLSLPVF